MLFSAARSQSRLQKEEIEEALIREIEESLRDGEPAVDDTATDQNENLPSSPLRFVLHYLKYYRWPLLTIVALELGQAICQILIPKAVQGVIDSAIPLQGQPNVSIWSALSGPMKFFVILNIGILLFSRCSGALLVTVGPVLRRRVRSSLYRYLQGHSQRYFMGTLRDHCPIAWRKCRWVSIIHCGPSSATSGLSPLRLWQLWSSFHRCTPVLHL
jgi:ABC-type bacteriocin/lantibiotic exporter with double-glycine peptidase domain